MKIFVSICLFLCICAALSAVYVWPNFSQIRHYTEDDLIGLTCEELGEKHEEVIFAYHDASIAHYRRTGAFEDDLGLPKDEVLPFVILMKKFIQDNDLRAFDLSKPFSISTAGLESDFFAEFSDVCASNPSLPAIDAVGQAAKRLKLTPGPATP